MDLLGLLEPQSRVSWAHDLPPCCLTALPVRGPRTRERVPAGRLPSPPQSSRLCTCAIPRGPGHWRLGASSSLAQAGTVSLGQATALASGCEVSAHRGHCQSWPRLRQQRLIPAICWA